MPKSALVASEVAMTPAQIRKLMRGQTTLLKADQLKGKGTRIHLAPSKHKKLARAGTKNKGFRLAMTQEEIAGSGMVLPPRSRGVKTAVHSKATTPVETGGNLKNLGRQIKRGFQKAGQEIKSGVNEGLREYREKVRPVVGPVIKEAVKQAISKGIPAAAGAAATALGQPELAGPAATVASMAANKLAGPAAEKLGQITGAYGMMRGGRLEENYSPFLNAQHPAMSPALPPADHSLPIVGGSFRAIGSSYMGGRGVGMVGTAMNPAIPQGDNSMIRLHGRGFRAI